MAQQSIINWIEFILLSTLLITIIFLIVVDMNVLYGEDYRVSLADNGTQRKIQNYMESSQQKVLSGSVREGTDSLILTESYGILTGAISIVWSFISGSFINSLVELLNLGEAAILFANTLRIIWIIGLIATVLYAAFKVVT